ncbi:dTMP kinase [Pelagibacterales bacterium SAG-MED38]|nr:dTMP kinase [Pelagibacterales bacterium SAG-MED38]
MSKKPVIVFEGIEGSGKTHHLNIISKYLKRRKLSFVKIREPGGSINSEKIRKLILDKKSNFNKNTDLLLYLASRSENIDLLKKYYKKRIILIDRFIDSTISYQHYGMGVNLNLINIINKHILLNFKVSFTFLNIVNHKNMVKRLKSRKFTNRYDHFKKKFYDKVQKGFIKLSKQNRKKYQIINSNLNIKLNEKLILKKIDKLIK